MVVILMGGPVTLHVAKRARGGWKVLQEGAATASCHRSSREAAIEAARAIAAKQPGALIKVHREDNTVERVIPFAEVPEQPA